MINVPKRQERRLRLKRYVFDSFAILSYFYGQQGADKVERLLRALESNGKTTAWLNLINLGEIYYIISRNEGFDRADRAVALTKKWPIDVLHPSEKLTLSAARIKAGHPLSYADAFVVATALEKEAIILTGDPEFKQLEDLVELEWLGPATGRKHS